MSSDRFVSPYVIIGICTRGRSDELRRVLSCLNEQRLPDPINVAIVIVDNNAEPSALLPQLCADSAFDVHIHSEPRAGLANARNALLDVADDMRADWIIGIDDDVWMEPDWLLNWSNAILSGRADCFVGASTIVYDRSKAPLLPSVYKMNHASDQDKPKPSTVNYAIAKKVFSKAEGAGIRFDHAFNLSGGEDAEFFQRAKRQFSFELATNIASPVWEARSGKRLSLWYELTRNVRDQVNGFRISQSHRKMGIFEPEHRMVTMLALRTNRSIVIGSWRILSGLLLAPFKPQQALPRIGFGLGDLARAWAVVPFVFNWTSREYGDQG